MTPGDFAKLAQVPTRKALTKVKNKLVHVVHTEHDFNWIEKFIDVGGGDKFLDMFETLCSVPVPVYTFKINYYSFII